MVASGVPEKIDTHAQEICRMALDLLAKVSQKYKISKILVTGLSNEQNIYFDIGSYF